MRTFVVEGYDPKQLLLNEYDSTTETDTPSQNSDTILKPHQKFHDISSINYNTPTTLFD